MADRRAVDELITAMPGGGAVEMVLTSLLCGLSRETFLDEYYLKLPFAHAGGCRPWIHCGDQRATRKLLARPQGDVLVATPAGASRPALPLAADAIDEILAGGGTIGLRHAHLHDPALADLAAAFAAEFLAPVDIHLYMTAAGSAGFGWHYDAEDVFVLQSSGTKLWELRKNTVNPWPVFETLPDDMRYEREIMPIMRCTLAEGDWLYIPGGYWHRTQAATESISLSVGIATPTGLTALDFVRQELLDSLRWRERLRGLVDSSSESTGRDSLAGHFAALGEDLMRQFTDPSTAERFRNYCQSRAQNSNRSPVQTPGSHRLEGSDD